MTSALLVLHHHNHAHSGIYLTCQEIATHIRHKGIMKSMASKQPFNKSIKVIYLTPKVKNENKPLASRREDFWRQHSVLSRISYHQGRINTLIIFCLFVCFLIRSFIIPQNSNQHQIYSGRLLKY